jgi:hypothetical protein
MLEAQRLQTLSFQGILGIQCKPFSIVKEKFELQVENPITPMKSWQKFSTH